ncbi:hypothetical protein PARMER_01380 [Parabacteroides merdae ATCC 43184]|nr:hypothetical protein PARMER_01380 [Parabacteroides merdae ATCC 43184]
MHFIRCVSLLIIKNNILFTLFIFDKSRKAFHPITGIQIMDIPIPNR